MTPALLEAVDEFLRVSAPGHAAHERKRAKLNLEAAATETRRYGAWRMPGAQTPPTGARMLVTARVPGADAAVVLESSFVDGSGFDFGLPNDEVIAWQPWPEPYRPALNPGAAWPFPKRDKT